MVVPMRVASAGFVELPGFATLTLNFLPEPSTRSSLAAGASLLAFVGGLRRRRQRARALERP
jgi:hypothetical protein